MKTHLCIGILDLQPGWEILLRQIGVDYVETTPEALVPGLFSVVIVNKLLSSAEAKAVEQYLTAGGAVLDMGDFLKVIEPGSVKSRHVRTVFPATDDPLFSEVELLDIYTSVYKYTSAQYLDGTVFLGNYGQGHLAFAGFDIDHLIGNTKSRRKQFYREKPPFPHEIIAHVSKGALRQVITILLKELHIRRDLPFVHRWYFPDHQETVFLFRIDSDGASAHQVRTWCETARAQSIRMTWFLHLENYQQWLSVFHEYPDQETAVHAWRHKTFSDYKQNWWNIDRACSVLLQEGFSFEGYASPYGTWNLALARAVEQHEFVYSSEFSLCYDDLPFFPWVEDHFSSVLQIPIHPMCIGNFLQARMTPQDMKEYYHQIIDRKRHMMEPLVFYDHPLHSYPEVVGDMFSLIQTLGIQNLTFAEYAHWWKQRLDSSFSAESDGLSLSIISSDPSVHICAWKSHQEYSFPVAETMISALQWRKRPESTSKPLHHIEAIRKPNLELYRASYRAFMNRKVFG